MEKQKPRQHNLDDFMSWSEKVIKKNKKRKGDIKDEQKQETAGMLHSRS